MFSSPQPHEIVMRKLEQLELNLAEANLALVELRKGHLQLQATFAEALGEIARLSIASNDTVVAHHSTSIAVNRAQAANRVLRKLNSTGKSFEPLQKEVPSGDEAEGGVHLAEHLRPESLSSWQSWPPIARPLVGELPPRDLFPNSSEAISNLTDDAILRLIAFYNESFGIAVEDSLSTRQAKFRIWCTLS